MSWLVGVVVRASVIVGMILSVAGSAGCSELEVERLSSIPPNAPLVGALTYYLPRTVITINGTVSLDQCDASVGAQGEEIRHLTVTVALTPVISYEPDPSHHYSIAYESSRSWMKELQIEVNNSSSGTLQSFNGTINDQVGPTIVAAIGAATQIGTAISVGGIPTPRFIASHVFSLQNPDLKLSEVKKLEDYCAGVRDGLNAIEAQQQIIDNDKKNPAKSAGDLGAQNAEVQYAQSIIDKNKKDKKLVRSFTFRWVPRHTDQFRYYKETHATPVWGGNQDSPIQGYWVAGRRINLIPIIRQWLTDAGQQWISRVPAGKGLTETDNDDPRRQLNAPYMVSLAFADTSMGDPRENENTNPGVANPAGLVIRDPAMGLLRICHLSDPICDSDSAVLLEDRPVETTTEVNRQSISVAQFGRILVLPQRSGLFENAVLAAGLNQDGTISKMSFHSSGSLISNLGALGTAANNVTSGISARNTAIGNVNTAEQAILNARTTEVQAPGVYNKALADCIANQAAIIKAGYKPAVPVEMPQVRLPSF